MCGYFKCLLIKLFLLIVCVHQSIVIVLMIHGINVVTGSDIIGAGGGSGGGGRFSGGDGGGGGSSISGGSGAEFIFEEIEAPCELDLRNGGRVCNCGFRSEDMVLSPMGLDGSILNFRIMNCRTLRIKSETFLNLSMMRLISFTNIENLILDQRSLAFRVQSNKIRIEFQNVIIEELPSHVISGNIDSLTFDRCKIGVIRPFCITGLPEEMFNFQIQNSTINRIDGQAFKKMSIRSFSLINTDFLSIIPSRAFIDIDSSNELLITNSNFTGISTGAFMFKDVKSFQMTNNRIEQLNGDSLQMSITDAIGIRENQINFLSSAAFRSILLDDLYFSRHSEPLEFHFVENTINITDEPVRLIFSTNFQIHLSKFRFGQTIECFDIDKYIENNFFHQYGENIWFKMSWEPTSEDEKKNADSRGFLTFSYIVNQTCRQQSYLAYVLAGVGVTVIILIVILVVILMLYYRRRRQLAALNVVQPEGRTYREVQIVMQIENAGLLKTDL